MTIVVFITVQKAKTTDYFAHSTATLSLV